MPYRSRRRRTSRGGARARPRSSAPSPSSAASLTGWSAATSRPPSRRRRSAPGRPAPRPSAGSRARCARTGPSGRAACPTRRRRRRRSRRPCSRRGTCARTRARSSELAKSAVERVHVDDPAVADPEARRVVHPAVDRDHHERAGEAGDRDRDAGQEVRRAARGGPSRTRRSPMKIASTKNEKPSSAKPRPNTSPNVAMNAGPEQAELEAEDRPGDDADREQREHHARPAPGQRPVERDRRCAARATRRTGRARGTRSRSRRAGCGRRARAPASAAPAGGSAGRRSGSPLR